MFIPANCYSAGARSGLDTNERTDQSVVLRRSIGRWQQNGSSGESGPDLSVRGFGDELVGLRRSQQLVGFDCLFGGRSLPGSERRRRRLHVNEFRTVLEFK